ATGSYNRPFVTPEMQLIEGYGRVQGIVYRRGDARFEGRGSEEALAAALADPECAMVNRNAGSGTRILIDRLLAAPPGDRMSRRQPVGYAIQAKSHNA